MNVKNVRFCQPIDSCHKKNVKLVQNLILKIFLKLSICIVNLFTTILYLSKLTVCDLQVRFNFVIRMDIFGSARDRKKTADCVQ